MDRSTRQYVFDTLEILSATLRPFVEERLDSTLPGHWQSDVKGKVSGLKVKNGELSWDLSGLLKAIMTYWQDVFKAVLGPVERSYISEVLEVRNRLSHNEDFSLEDAERALDTVKRLLESISAGDAVQKVDLMRIEVMKLCLDQQNYGAGQDEYYDGTIRTGTGDKLRPWREVIRPRDDVTSGNFQAAEFAADLFSVHAGKSSSVYGDPDKFFRRTYLTNGLGNLLINCAKRLTGKGGDPVIELQTNFGGGKTHSMLALYHMCGTISASGLPGVDELLSANDVVLPENIRRAVIVGTARSPAKSIKKASGVEISTLWGDMAYQLGGEDGYAIVADSDQQGMSPGVEELSNLFEICAPSLILIDEWVAYLRQLYRAKEGRAGTFDANLTFVQALTEAVKISPQTFLVASLPESVAEAGGDGGVKALNSLKATFGRIDARWSPASTEEGYEIVRRRLFQDITGDAQQKRDEVVLQYTKMYRDNVNFFSSINSKSEYQRMMERSYPIHPELFDKLNNNWGGLERFQKTRGVLRMMANMIHDLWMKTDPSLMIMSGGISVASQRVRGELLKCLPPEWGSVIDADIDGGSSIPFKSDQESQNLGQISATRRVARAIFMATAPLEGSKNRSIETEDVLLSVCQPRERPAIFGDALNHLAGHAKYMHTSVDGFWYSLTPSLNRLADEIAKEQEDSVVDQSINEEILEFVRAAKDREPFHTIQAVPGGSVDIPDDPEGVRLIVLGVDHSHNGQENSPAFCEAQDMLVNRGSRSRIYRNTLLFLVMNQDSLPAIREAMRKRIGWSHVLSGDYNLRPNDVSIATRNSEESIRALSLCLQEAFCYVLQPIQESPQDDVKWDTTRIVSQDGLFSQIGKKLVSIEGIFTEIGAGRLHTALSEAFWKEQPFQLTSDIWEHCNRFIYLPRMISRGVLQDSITKAISGNVPGPFAYADSARDDGGYDGLLINAGSSSAVVIDSKSVIVRADVAHEQASTHPHEVDKSSKPRIVDSNVEDSGEIGKSEVSSKTFYGMVELSSERPAKDMSSILEEVVSHITSAPGGSVTLRLEIDGDFPNGLDEGKVRTILENAKVLGFKERQIK